MNSSSVWPRIYAPVAASPTPSTPDSRNTRKGLAPYCTIASHYLQSQASVPEFQVRFRWRPNSVALWDNRRTQHYAVMDYWPAPRKMERAGIVGDRPY